MGTYTYYGGEHELGDPLGDPMRSSTAPIYSQLPPCPPHSQKKQLKTAERAPLGV